MGSNVIKVLLVSPAKAEGGGGILSWTRHVLAHYKRNTPDGVEMELLPIERKYHITASMSMFKRFILGCWDYKDLLGSFRLKLKGNHYDLVHLCTSAGMGLVRDWLMLKIAKKNNVKSAIHFHFGRIPDLFAKGGKEFFFLTKVCQIADSLIVMDARSYEILKNSGYSDKVYYLPNPLADNISKYANSHVVKRNPNLIVFAGHLSVTKGVLELVEACKNIPNIKVKMFGYGSDDMIARIKTKSDFGNWLEFCGLQSQEKVLDGMLQCGLFVLPTYTEGFPNVILESMACGCPIITTPVGAIPEMLDITSREPCGVCVPVKDVLMLHDAIAGLQTNYDKALLMGERAKVRVQREYGMPVVWEKMAGIWKDTVKCN